jgi:peroxiredoxin
LGEWQRNELAGQEMLSAVVGMTESIDFALPTPQDLQTWEMELDLECDMLADPEQQVLDMYIQANPENVINVAVSVLIDKKMVIREIYGEDEGSISLTTLQQLLAE